MKKLFFWVWIGLVFTACSTSEKATTEQTEKKQQEVKKANPAQRELEVM